MRKSDLTFGGLLRDPILLCTVTAGMILRFLLIDKESLWYDEIFSIRLASDSLTAALNAEPNNPPLHFVLLHFWILLFGASAFSARALSVIPSVIAIATAYILANRLFDRTTARIAALFLCCSSFQIYYAQEARTFSLLLCLLTLSLVGLERIIFGASTRRDWILYIVATIISLYAHFYAVFFVVSHTLLFFALWRVTRVRFRQWLTAQLIIGVCFLPWLIKMLSAASGGGQQRRHLLLKLPQSFFSFLVGDTLIPLDERAVQSIGPTLLGHLPELIATAIGFGFFAVSLGTRLRQHKSQVVFCLTLIVVPTLIAFIVSFKIMLFEERYLIGVTVPLAILLSASAASCYRSKYLSRLGIIAGGLVFGVSTLSLYNYYFDPRFGRDEWRGATAYIDQISEEDDVLLLQPDYISICYDYYSQDPVRIRIPILDQVLSRSAPENATLYSALETASRIILVRSNYRDDTFLQSLRKEFTLVSERQFEKDKGISVYLLSANSN